MNLCITNYNITVDNMMKFVSNIDFFGVVCSITFNIFVTYLF